MPLRDFPVETLIHIFAHLEPKDLKHVQIVCKQWKSIVSDDACWKQAFESFFGACPFERISASWKQEYITRFRLQWNFGRGRHVITFSPRLTQVDKVFVEEQGILWAGSLEEGIVAQCHYTTGKVDKDFIYSNAQYLRQPVSCIEITRDRIYFGLVSGKLVVYTDFHYKTGNLSTFTGMHSSHLVKIQAFSDHDRVLSFSTDLHLKIWSVSSLSCLVTLDQRHFASVPAFILTNETDFITSIFKNGQGETMHLDMNSIGTRTESVLHKTEPLALPLPQAAWLPIDTRPTLIHASTLKDPSFGVFIYSLPMEQGLFLMDMTHNKKLEIVFSKSDASAKTSVTCCFIHETEHRWFIFMGHADGSLCLLDIPPLQPSRVLDPTYTIHIKKYTFLGYHKAPICRVTMDAYKFTSAALDGSIKCWDLMKGTLLATLHMKPQRLVEYQNDLLVLPTTLACHVWSDQYKLIACFGDTFKYWYFDPHFLKSTHKKASKTSRISLGLKNSLLSSSPKSPTPAEIQFTVKDDLNEHHTEKHLQVKEDAKRKKLYSRINGALVRGSGSQMTEEELIQYAQLLSMEELSPTVGTSAPITIQTTSSLPVSFDASSFPPISPASASPNIQRFSSYASSLKSPTSYSEKLSQGISPTLKPIQKTMSEEDELQYALELSLIEN